MHDEARRACSLPGAVELIYLLRRAQRHDAAAFEQIYERFADTIYRYGLYQLLTEQAAAALVTTTLEQAVRDVGRFEVRWRDSVRHTRNWLLRIAVIQAARYNATKEEALAATDDADAPLPPPGDTRLIAALGQLAPEQRQIVVLRLIVRLPVVDIAEITGQSTALILIEQARGLTYLAAHLDHGATMRTCAA